MTDAYKCNRCGNFEEGEPTGTIETTLIRGKVELCKNCVYKFKRFIKYAKEPE